MHDPLNRTILIHACCGPCLTGPWEELLKHDYNPHVYWYNPNIHPSMEYLKRLESLREFVTMKSGTLHEETKYDFREFLRETVNLNRQERCNYCYGVRLNATARKAAELGISFFTTTLSVSPYQDHESIQEAGKRAAKQHGVDFKYFDWRDIFREYQNIAREIGLYSQAWCGCMYSETERYAKKLKREGIEVTYI